MLRTSPPPGLILISPNNVEIVLLDVELSIVTSPIVAVSAINTLVVNVPLTSNSVRGASVLMPMRPLTTSIYNRSVSTAMFTPSRRKLLASNGPVMRPTAMLSPYTPSFTDNHLALRVYHSIITVRNLTSSVFSGNNFFGFNRTNYPGGKKPSLPIIATTGFAGTSPAN